MINIKQYCAVQERLNWERDVSPVPSRSNYAKVAFAQYPADIATCHWSIGELTAATSGADGKRRRVFKKVRLSGLGGLRVKDM